MLEYFDMSFTGNLPKLFDFCSIKAREHPNTFIPLDWSSSESRH